MFKIKQTYISHLFDLYFLNYDCLVSLNLPLIRILYWHFPYQIVIVWSIVSMALGILCPHIILFYTYCGIDVLLMFPEWMIVMPEGNPFVLCWKNIRQWEVLNVNKVHGKSCFWFDHILYKWEIWNGHISDQLVNSVNVLMLIKGRKLWLFAQCIHLFF